MGVQDGQRLGRLVVTGECVRGEPISEADERAGFPLGVLDAGEAQLLGQVGVPFGIAGAEVLADVRVDRRIGPVPRSRAFLLRS